MNFYAKCEDIGFAKTVFDEIPDRNLVFWTLECDDKRYAKVELVNEALDLLREMLKMGVKPDKGWLA